jgi:hypothetical protein
MSPTFTIEVRLEVLEILGNDFYPFYLNHSLLNHSFKKFDYFISIFIFFVKLNK